MISPYHEIITADEDNFEEFLKKVHLIGIFKGILEEFADQDLFKGIVKFIAWGYSVHSDYLHTSGNSWDKVSEYIFDKTDLPRGNENEIFNAVAKLQSAAVRDAIERWLQFQNSDPFSQYIHYRDLRREFLALSLSNMRKATGEIDVEAKMKAALYSRDLLKMMEDAKDTFIQNTPKLKGSVEALNRAAKDKMSRNAGSYAL